MSTATLTALLHLAAESRAELDRVVAELLPNQAEAVGVDRVGVWRLEDAGRVMRCFSLFDACRNAWESGACFTEETCPGYFAALREEEIMAVEDARHHPATREFALDYLEPHGVGAMLIVPVWEHGALWGALCYEHVGWRRAWRPAECTLAATSSELLMLALERGRNERLEGALRRSRQAIRVRDDFMSVAAHELKNPLTTLKLQLQMLGVKCRAALGDTSVDPYLAMAQRQVARLSSLIHELLDLAQLSSGRMPLHRHPMDLTELVRVVADSFRDEAARVGSRLDVHLPRQVVGRWDESRIEQVVTNLISNALKYGSGKPVEVELYQDGDEAVLRVTDHGIGIRPEDRDRVFAPFERAASPRRYGGLGLGLFISRRIVLAHHGELRVESEYGRGSTFTVRLPRWWAAQEAEDVRLSNDERTGPTVH